MGAILVSGLTKSYGDNVALAGVNFEVGAVETVAILGPNGAGKTTTVEILEGFRSRDGGQVSVLGEGPREGCALVASAVRVGPPGDQSRRAAHRQRGAWPLRGDVPEPEVGGGGNGAGRPRRGGGSTHRYTFGRAEEAS